MQDILQAIKAPFEAAQTRLVEPLGTLLLGPTPHKGKDTWFHELFRPLSQSEIGSLEKHLGKPLHPDFLELLTLCNGLRLFSDELALFGLRDSHIRTGDAIWQPYDLVDPNRMERPRWLPSGSLILGAYSYDGSLVAQDLTSGTITVHERDQGEALGAGWPGLKAFLGQEIGRLQNFFGKDYGLLDPDACTLPS